MKRWIAIAVLSVALLAALLWRRTPVEVKESHVKTNATAEHKTTDTETHVVEHRVTTTERTKGGDTRTITVVDRGTQIDKADRADVARVSQESFSKVTKAAPGYRLHLDPGWNPRALSLIPSELTIGVDRRLFGPVWIGAWVRQDLTTPIRPATAAGLSLGFEF